MNLFHHEMLKAALFSRFCIPLDLGGLLFDFITIQVIEMSLTRNKFCKLKVSNIIHIASVFQDCRNIRKSIRKTTIFSLCKSPYKKNGIIIIHISVYG